MPVPAAIQKAYAVAARGSKTSSLWRTYAVIAAAALVAAAACSTAGGVQGRRVVLAYTKSADTTRQSVWVADRNGRHGRRLARGRAPVVSPDGSQVAFAGGCTGDPPADCTKLYVVSTGGGSPRLLGRAEGPAWAPDSSRVVARSGRQLVSVGVDSGEKVVLDRGAFFGWTISPNGRKVAYGRGPSDDP